MHDQTIFVVVGFLVTNILAMAGLWVKIERRLTTLETHMSNLIKIHDREIKTGAKL